jgi:hypothetical protein
VTTATPGSTAESRTAALAMFEGNVPCLFQLTDPSCPETAKWLAAFIHEENTARCDGASLLWPVCDTHKKMIQVSSHPFWRMWHTMKPVNCDQCGTPIRLASINPI